MASSRSGLCFLPSGFFACLSGLARFLVPGLHELIQYTPSLCLVTPTCGLAQASQKRTPGTEKD